MPAKIHRARRTSSSAFFEALEPRQLLSGLGFGATIHPNRSRPDPAGSSSPQFAAITTYPPGSMNSNDAFNFNAYQDLHGTSLALNNPGGVALMAADKVPFSGPIGTLSLFVPFSHAATPVQWIQRAFAGESLYVVIDWGDGSPQSLGNFQSKNSDAYTISGDHTYTRPGDYRLTAFLIVNGTQSNLPWVVAQSVGIAHVDSTPASTEPPVVLHLPLYDPRNYVPPAFPQIKLPTDTPTDGNGNSQLYDFVVG